MAFSLFNVRKHSIYNIKYALFRRFYAILYVWLLIGYVENINCEIASLALTTKHDSYCEPVNKQAYIMLFICEYI
jgi:hypothetical protein